MAGQRLLTGLKRFLATRRRDRPAGFTLLELLVAMIIGAIITVGLLSFVVDLVRTNQMDIARSETQRDVQMAMNYIAQDLREAVYVYDGNCLQGSGSPADLGTYCPGIANPGNNILPTSLKQSTASADSIPMLAFWRVDPFPDAIVTLCKATYSKLTDPSKDPSKDKTSPVYGIPCLSGKTYSLVVYILQDDKDPNDIWPGKARLVRYQFNQFPNGAVNSAYVAPLQSQSATFQQWPNDTDNNPSSPNLPAPGANGTSAVLVDFIDDGQNPTGAPARPTITPLCPNVATSTNPYALTPRDDFSLNPKGIRSFYACVRGKTLIPAGTTDPVTESGVNQEVLLVITGNAEGRAGLQNTFQTSDPDFNTKYRDRFLFTQQTRVLVRGSINKTPTS
jgi:prepilin-type N-terminal cleavage/methylation domain-containing protein